MLLIPELLGCSLIMISCVCAIALHHQKEQPVAQRQNLTAQGLIHLVWIVVWLSYGAQSVESLTA